MNTNLKAEHDKKFGAPAKTPMPPDHNDIPKPKPTCQEPSNAPDPNQEEALRRIKRMAENQRPNSSNIAEESHFNSEELPEVTVDCSNERMENSDIGETENKFDGEEKRGPDNKDILVEDNDDNGDI